MTRLSRPAIALILVACGAMLVFFIGAAACPAAYDYGGGDTATWIWLLRHGHPIYGPLGGLPMLRTNYPPLQSWLVAHLAPSDGAILLTGRLLSLAGLALGAAMVFLSIEAATGARRTALLGALLFAGTLRIGYWGLVCRGDAIALGLELAAVTLAARRVRGWWILAAPLFALAALSKHSLIVLPLGLGAWALWRAPRKAIALGALTAALIALPLIGLGLTDPLLRWSRAPWSLANFLRWSLYAVAPSVFGIALCLGALKRWPALPERARQALEPWAVVLVVGLAWTAALGRRGSGSNYVMELCTAIVVLSVSVAEAGLFRRLFLAHLGLTAFETVMWVGFLFGMVLPQARARHEETRRALAGVPGPVLAEETWTTTALGRPPVVIPFLSTQLAYSGRWDAHPLVDALEQGRIARVLVDFPPGDRSRRDRFTPEELDAIARRYVTLSRAGGLYVCGPR